MSRADAPTISSAEIVAVTTELRQRHRRKKKGTKASKEKEAEDDAKRELNMEEHKQTLPEILANLESDLSNGMQVDSAGTRLELEGLNRLSPPKQTPEIVKYIRELTGLFSLLLWVGCVLCLVLYGIQGDDNNLYLGIVLGLVVIISGTFSYLQNRKSSNLMESFKNMMPTMATVIRDGNSQKIDATKLVRGDIVLLKGGDKVPADMRIVECSDDLAVDNSCLTGEPEPLKRVPECTDDSPLETKNLCFFGTFIPQGSGKGIVIRVGDNTVMGRIAKLATHTGGDMTPIEKELNHFVHMIAGVSVVIALVFFIIGMVIQPDVVSNIVFMIGIIIANVPEGLLATVTVCLSLAANRMAHKSVLVKHLQGVETLGSTTCICSDKTGTLTQNVMTVAQLVYDNQPFDAECSITPKGSYDLESPSYQALQRCATLCNNAVFDEDSKFEKVVSGDNEVTRGASKSFKSTTTTSDGRKFETVQWETIGDASESAMIKFCHDKRDIMEYRASNEKIKEIPFNSKNKYQISIHHQETPSEPLLLVMKGAPERITARCDRLLLNGEEVPLTKERLDEIEACQLELSKKGMRVLGFAQQKLDPSIYDNNYEFNTDNPNFPLGEKDVDYEMIPKPDPKIEQPLCFIGLMALIDPPRPEVPIAVAKCKSAGIKVIMVTGDHPITAKAIAHKVGILWGPTSEDIQEENETNGYTQDDPNWRDPSTAPAIVVPGWTISVDTPEAEWDRILNHNQVVFARTSPQQKLIIVENCQRRREIVAVTGDGVNDSPALKKADIGIAMGIMGSAVSKEAADMILLDDNFASIVCGVEEGRIIFDNLKKSIAYALSVNIPQLMPFLLYATVRFPLPLTTVLMLLICIGTDMVPSIALAYESAENDIMLRSPRVAHIDRLVTKKLIGYSYTLIGIIQAAAGMFTYMVVLNDYGYPPSVLPGLGFKDTFGKQVLWCRTSGGEYCSAGGQFKDGNGNLKNLGSTNEAQCGPNYDESIPTDGNIFDARIFFHPAHDGEVLDCQFPFANLETEVGEPNGYSRTEPSTYDSYMAKTPVVTYQAMQAAWNEGYRPYYPLKARRSSFFDMRWFKYSTSNTDLPGMGSGISLSLLYSFQPYGVWGITSDETRADMSVDTVVGASDAFNGKTVNLVNEKGERKSSLIKMSDSGVFKSGKMFEKIVSGDGTEPCTGDECLLDFAGGFTKRDGDKTVVNVASRMLQFSALSVAQTAYFVATVMLQLTNVMICKTRYLSVTTQGMRNVVLNFGLMFEVVLISAVAYAGFLNTVFGTMDMRLVHWFPVLPFCLLIMAFDEGRKYVLRSTSRSVVDKGTGRMIRYPGWIETNTYY